MSSSWLDSRAGWNRWMPAVRGFISGCLGVAIGVGLAQGKWPGTAFFALSLVAMWWMPTRALFQARRKTCLICGERAAWLFSLVPPPNRGLRWLVPEWGIWAACNLHRHKVQLSLATVLTHPSGEHRAVHVYEAPNDWGRRL